MKAKVTVNFMGQKIDEYEIENYHFPDIKGFLDAMKKLGIKTNCNIEVKKK